MKIGKYIIHSAKYIKTVLTNRDIGTDVQVARMLQVYNCRILGFCFYRDEEEHYVSAKKIFPKSNVKKWL